MSAEVDADFIAVYDNALDRDACAAIVARVRASAALRPGRIGSGVFPELKHSRDLALPGKPEWADVEAALARNNCFRCSDGRAPDALGGGSGRYAR